MNRILVSACLMGDRVRYDGDDNKQDNHYLDLWLKQGRVVTICPEVAGGLPVPRTPSEIEGGDGYQVLANESRVVNLKGVDVTDKYLTGARQALELVKIHHIRIAILKENSPSCGSSFTYDGSFQRNLQPGNGVTAAMLKQNGVIVFSENQVSDAATMLATIERQ